MKKGLILLIVVLLLFASVSSSFAVSPPRGGLPAAHEVEGRTLGAVAAGFGTTNPGFFAGHIIGGIFAK